ncbi:MAG: DUF222 domain-containing protein [Dermatophilus congolensis]|nr:DUF222 domain-containing protein [Dermatophilus congolensis]
MSGVGAGLLAQFASVRRVLADIPAELTAVGSVDLARLTAEASAVVAAAEAARAAVVLEADARGVIASSDNPRVDRFVEQACRDAGVPVSTRQAAALKDISVACEGHDITPLRDAVTSGRVGVDSAALAARFYRKIKSAIGPGNWGPVLGAIIDTVANGATARDLDGCADQIIGQYGDPGVLDLDHETKHVQRDVTAFRRDKSGMLTATMRLDPASEAVVTAALTAMSVPAPAPDGTRDLRTIGQRRADALVTLAGLAAQRHDSAAGTGAKAKVYVTISHDALTTDLSAEGINPYSGHRHDCPFTTTMRAPEAAARAASGPHPLLEDLGMARMNHGIDASLACTCGAIARGVGLTEHGQVLTPAEVRMLACDAGIIPIVLGGRGEVLDVGRQERWVTAAQRAALVIRDGGCSFPGCDAPPSWCDGHHLTKWEHGGPSDMTNLALLCRHHHREAHIKGHAGTATTLGVTCTRSDGTPLGNTPRPERCR